VSLSVELVGAGDPLEAGTVGLLALAAEGEGAPRLLGTESAAASGLPVTLEAEECSRDGFVAKVGQVHRMAALATPRVLAVGLGPEAQLDPERYRRAAAAFVRAAGRGDAALIVPADAPVAALAEGALLAAYRFDAYRSSPAPGGLERLLLIVPAGSAEPMRAPLAEGAAAADAVCFARDLVNTPPSDLDPETFAARVVERMEGRPGVEVEVWDEQRIETERLGGLLTVARGSSRPPRLVLARYEPPEVANDAPHVVLVGKGITFDSGGLSLKTAAGMMTMKTDMSGAAIVMAVVSACADLGVGARVSAFAMVTENMPGPNAVKPGDVFRARNGLTVEVLNTDAEGRLVLADGLSLAAELEPDAIVDVATLTGAQVVALGRSIGALFGNDQELIDQLARAGSLAGEPLWPMPLPEDYANDIDSEIADMKNMGRADREAGAIAAAMLLSRFVGDSRWAHLDIAGPARAAESSGYLVRGGTGFGVRALLSFLRARSS
jgi:leucyl aminopeptidase